MQYIVIDLEWNQPLSYDSHVYRTVGDRLIFEMIQIGAVKLDDSLRVTDSLSLPIRPQHYVKIHPRIRRMTKLTDDVLADAPIFQEAMRRFMDWCGPDAALLTWGCDDISVWQQNIDFYGWKEPLPPFYDIQPFFSAVHQVKDRKGLKTAMEMLEIEEDESLHFHNALYDAYYTALVFAKLPEPEGVLRYPQQPKQLIHPRQDKTKGESFDSLEAALKSEAAVNPRCPTCGKQLRMEEEGWVRQSADRYINVGHCPHHGQYLVRLRFSPMPGGKLKMAPNCMKATRENIAYVHTKRLQVARKDAAWVEAHGALPDPEEAIRQADRASMPFDE